MIEKKTKVSINFSRITLIAACALLALVLFAHVSGNESLSNEPASTSYVGSESCRDCHMEQYVGWQKTVHGKMLIPAELVEEDNPVRKAFEDEITTGSPRIQLNHPGQGEGPPADSWKDVDYVVGGNWKARYVKLVEGKGHRFYDAQYNITGTQSGKMTAYSESRNYEDRCLGCHTTGFDYDLSKSLDRSATDYSIESIAAEVGIGCEACHGPGEKHVNEPETKGGIINPADYTVAERTEFCGSCHGRNMGHRTIEGHQDPIGFSIGKYARDYTKIQSLVRPYDGGWEYDPSRFWDHGAGISHRMQYNDYEQGPHWGKISCSDCHNSHGVVPNSRPHGKVMLGGVPTVVRPASGTSALKWPADENFCYNCHSTDQQNYTIEAFMPMTSRSSAGALAEQRSHTFWPRGMGNPHPSVDLSR